MKSILLFSVFQLFLLLPTGVPEEVPQKERFTVYLFLGEECIISQQYTLLMSKLYQEYSSEELKFIGLFPNPSSSESKISNFQKKYQVPFELRVDALQFEMDRFGVKVTPEVVVFDQTKKLILYQGRIDNTFFRVGKRRTVTTTSELEDVLRAISNGNPKSFEQTTAVGCIITPLDGALKKMPMCKGEEANKK